MEVAVDCFESVINAQKGGAIRIELCNALSEGGLTPSLGFLKMCKTHTTLPIFPMIRCRGGDFVYSAEEMRIMADDIRIMKENGADGFVFGVLTGGNTLDKENCKMLLDVARPKPCTLHRAFDETVNCADALETAVELGFTRILTSGQQKDAATGIGTINNLINQAKERIIVMPGAGITALNLEEILLQTNAKEFHGSGKMSVNSNGQPRFITSCDNIKKIVTIYENLIERRNV
uniref:Copper homeostasis protein cutC homolog n=1 Tax=Panstrongylus megistus TaxID=65343 RepID=A0A069DQY7_9HEMI